MKRLHNEKGSVLVLIIVVIAVLSVLGTSILAAAFSNYKMKIINSSLKSNLYVSEAGLEETYAKIYQYVIAAVEKGKIEAGNKYEEFNEENIAKIEEIIGLIQNNPIVNTCIDGGDGQTEVDYDTLDYSKIVYPQIIKYTKGVETIYEFNREWVGKYPNIVDMKVEEAFSNAFMNEFVTQATALVDADGTSITSGVESALILTAEIYGKDGNRRLVKDISIDDFVDGKVRLPDNTEKDVKQLTFALDSKYEDDKTARNTLVDLVVTVPKYKEPYTIEISKKRIPMHPLWEQAIATDGLLSVNGTTKVNGKVFALGGVAAGGSMTVTGQTVVGKNSDIKITGGSNFEYKSIYARNVLLNKPNLTFTGIPGGGYYITDDFEMNDTGQKVTLNGSYYGFQDGSKGKNHDTSSGIIINSTDIQEGGSSFILNGDLYLNGTAYINVSPAYQTGESLSVIGNYLAYTMPLGDDSNYREDKMEFTYVDPLMLPTSFKNGSPFGLAEKVEYFMEYYNDNKDTLTTGSLHKNIQVNGNNIFSIGNVIVNNADGVMKQGQKTNLSALQKFNEMENNYYLMVDYLGYKNLKQASGVDKDITVNNDIKFDVNLEIETGKQIPEGFEYTSGNASVQAGTDKVFIICGGTVTIPAGTNVKGCIIAGGGVIVGDGATITYDEKVVLDAFSAYKNLQEVFNTKSDRNYEYKTYNSKSLVKAENDKGTNINYTSILDFKNWKINYD